MEERSVTIDGAVHPLPEGFTVFATMNPIELEGTFPLPEAQLDRFLMKIRVGEIDAAAEREVVARVAAGMDPWALASSGIRRGITSADLAAARAAVRKIAVEEHVQEYLVEIVRRTRKHSAVALGASTRAAVALLNASRARSRLHRTRVRHSRRREGIGAIRSRASTEHRTRSANGERRRVPRHCRDSGGHTGTAHPSRVKVMRPTRRLVTLLALAALPAALATRIPTLSWWVVAFDVALFSVVAVDARRARRTRAGLAIRRSHPTWVQRAREFEVVLELQNSTDRAHVVDIVDRFPETFEPRERRVRLAVGPRAVTASHSKVVAHRRGIYVPMAPLASHRVERGLVRMPIPGESGGAVSVLPDLSKLGQFDALVRRRRLHEIGIRRTRQRGEGTEAAGLKPYVAGDPYASIDWKATARKGALITREMQTERRQNVVVLLDCGRRMAREVEGRSRLDHAIEATLLLSHVALASDDRVGLMAFSDVIVRTIAVGRGVAHARALAQAVFAIEPTLREPPYRRMATEAMHRFPRRGLVVLFTDAMEPSSLETLVDPLRFLSRHHRVVCVVFKDDFLEAASNDPIEDDEALFRAGAAADLTIDRRRGMLCLNQTGATVIDVPTRGLSVAVVNRYLEIKARHGV